MFGTIITNPEALSPEEKERYQQAYCGLCHQLDKQFGSAGSATLTFDMTFLALLLGALYALPEQPLLRRCVPHPVKKHPAFTTQVTAYAASMNLALAYYQCLDDWNDDHNLAAREKSRQLEKFLPGIRQAYPRQCVAIEDGLQTLGQMEKANELNPDLPTNCFGELLGEVFCWHQDEYSPTLRRMGAALGRFVYLLDAVNDLKADIKKERYNPLVAQLDTDFMPVLTLMMAECTAAFEKLPITQDVGLMRNVLYSGVWQSLRVSKKQQEEIEQQETEAEDGRPV